LSSTRSGQVTDATLEVLHCAFAQGSFEATHDSRDEDGGVAGSPDEQSECICVTMNVDTDSLVSNSLHENENTVKCDSD
jgi:hypothetical protein